MSMEEAKKFQKVIVEDDKLKEHFKDLESRESVLDKALEIASEKGFDVSRADLEELMDELAEKSEELGEEALENVAGGGKVDLAWTLVCVEW